MSRTQSVVMLGARALGLSLTGAQLHTNPKGKK
jgi:hypothetical protein